MVTKAITPSQEAAPSTSSSSPVGRVGAVKADGSARRLERAGQIDAGASKQERDLGTHLR
jgi:hypothetical protein